MTPGLLVLTDGRAALVDSRRGSGRLLWQLCWSALASVEMRGMSVVLHSRVKVPLIGSLPNPQPYLLQVLT